MKPLYKHEYYPGHYNGSAIERYSYMVVFSKGAINIWAKKWHEMGGRMELVGGVEYHYRKCPDYMRNEAPSHEYCKLLKAPCWHEGSSLMFFENKALQNAIKNANHNHVFAELKELLASWDG